jgi:hypothetical protein
MEPEMLKVSPAPKVVWEGSGVIAAPETWYVE